MPTANDDKKKASEEQTSESAGSSQASDSKASAQENNKSNNDDNVAAGDGETPKGADDPGNPESGDNYDPFVDKQVPSSFIAEQIALERAGDDGKSPTQDAVHENDDKDDDDDSDSEDK